MVRGRTRRLQGVELAPETARYASLSRSFPDVVITKRSVYEEYRGRFLANDPVSYALSNRAFADSDAEQAVPGLRCPCLLLAGRHDLLRPPAEVHALAARLADARFEVIESGHIMPVQAPEALASHMLRFLAPENRVQRRLAGNADAYSRKQ